MTTKTMQEAAATAKEDINDVPYNDGVREKKRIQAKQGTYQAWTRMREQKATRRMKRSEVKMRKKNEERVKEHGAMCQWITK